jgi:ElaB/YqjD/DUF883 family membrane-anchored ribosome-binding protein
MGQTPDEIRHDIDLARNRLGQELNQLEYRVKREADWRVHFDRHPWWFVGGAFGTALLVGMILGRSGHKD